MKLNLNKIYEVGMFLLFAALCILLFLGLNTSADNTIRKRDELIHKQYQGWVRLNHREDIKFDEWKALKDGGLLNK